MWSDLPCYVTRMHDRSDGVIVFHGQSFSMMIDSLFAVVRETLAETSASMMSSFRLGINIRRITARERERRLASPSPSQDGAYLDVAWLAVWKGPGERALRHISRNSCIGFLVKGKSLRQHNPNHMSVETHALGRRRKPICRRLFSFANLYKLGLEWSHLEIVLVLPKHFRWRRPQVLRAAKRSAL